MRTLLLLLTLSGILGLLLWVSLSGAWLFMSILILLIFLVITVGYADLAVLFFLGAREIKSGDEEILYSSAAQEAYKLGVPLPILYLYNGTLERGFVLQNGSRVSIAFSRDLVTICSREELAAICFEFLLQVKKNLAKKRTKVMFVIGCTSWMSHLVLNTLLKIIPNKYLKTSVDWFASYFLRPWPEIVFRLTLGETHFKKIHSSISAYAREYDMLQKFGAKLRRFPEARSTPSRKLIEFSLATRSRHFQNILALELLPHEWDYIFDVKADVSAK